MPSRTRPPVPELRVESLEPRLLLSASKPMAANTVGVRIENDSLTYKGDTDVYVVKLDQPGWISASYEHPRCQGTKSLKLEGNGRMYDAGTPAATRKNINTADTQRHKNRYNGEILPAGEYRLTLTQTLERPKHVSPKSDEYTLVIVIDYSIPKEFGDNREPKGAQNCGDLAPGTSKSIKEWVGTMPKHGIDTSDVQMFMLTEPSVVKARVAGGNVKNVCFWIDTDGDRKPDRRIDPTNSSPREVTSPSLRAGPVWVGTQWDGGSKKDPYTLTVRAEAPPPGSWTVLVYMTGSNLNIGAHQDINEMEKALVSLPAGVRFVVAWDQPADQATLKETSLFATGRGLQNAWNTYGRSILAADSNMAEIASTFDLSLGERDMASPDTLEDFVRWGVKQAPARHYVLQMWGHGRGFYGSQPEKKGTNELLTPDEMASALTKSGMPTIEVLAYDNCMMAMAEVGTAISAGLSGIYVASQEVIPGEGQDYSTAFSRLATQNPASVTPMQLADGMVQSYQRLYGGSSTMSACSTSGYRALNDAVAAFVLATDNLADYHQRTLFSLATAIPRYGDIAIVTTVDLKRFMADVASKQGLPLALQSKASDVVKAVSAMVVSRVADNRGSGGISVYMPSWQFDPNLAKYPAAASPFCRATGWNQFLDRIVSWWPPNYS